MNEFIHKNTSTQLQQQHWSLTIVIIDHKNWTNDVHDIVLICNLPTKHFTKYAENVAHRTNLLKKKKKNTKYKLQQNTTLCATNAIFLTIYSQKKNKFNKFILLQQQQQQQ